MKQIFLSGIIALCVLGIIETPLANAETSTTTTTTQTAIPADTLKALMDKIAMLQKQLAELTNQVNNALKTGLVEGTTDTDVKKVQELLATDPTIYPEGKTTGYFGPLTKEAIKRFQKRHDLEVTGQLDDDTRGLMDTYFEENPNGHIPPGFLRAPGMMQKIEGKFKEECQKSTESVMGTVCKKHHDEMNKWSENEDKDTTSDTEEKDVLQHQKDRMRDMQKHQQDMMKDVLKKQKDRMNEDTEDDQDTEDDR